ncbi:MAG: ABC transporter ATP-binding protein [Nocardioidaceae bacterium]|nr:ABC transporter ATP-binding protein [Nocardioidaceae bacterium]
MAASSLEVEGLEVVTRAGVPILDDLSFRVAEGQALGIVGESGSGKSVALRATMGLPPAGTSVRAGTVMVGDRRVPAGSVTPAGVAMVFQDSFTSLDPTMRLGSYLAETVARHRGATIAAARSRARELLRDVGMTEPELRMRAFPHQLSGGLRQRAAIALALATDPRYLLCDEPTTALDVTLQARILALLKARQGAAGLGLVFVSHDIAVVSQIADVVAVMYAGRIVEIGPTATVIGSPRHPYAQALVAALPDLDRPGTRFLSIAGTPPDPSEFTAGCRFQARCGHPGTGCDQPLAGLDGRDHRHRSDCLHEDTHPAGRAS